ncbi:MAG: hypothetical protein D6722_26720, partial [Bacteroidetes bacterium]
MEKPSFRIVYAVLRILVRWAMKLFFRRIQYAGDTAALAAGRPLILAPNHGNAFMDALVVVIATRGRRQPSYITRSDVFVKSLQPIFDAFKMLPIYRQRDNLPDIRDRNERIFEICQERLHRSEAVLIFPEGNHGRLRRLRPLKKGFARIAFKAAEEAPGDFPLQIVPIGINYRDHLKFQTEVLMINGAPMDLAPYMASYRKNPVKALLEIRNDLARRMKDCVLHIGPAHYDLIEGYRQCFGTEVAAEMGLNSDDLYARFQAEKRLIARLESRLAAGDTALAAMGEKMAAYQKGLEALNFRDHVIRRGPYGLGALLGQGLALLLGLPVFLWGALNHLHVYHLIPRFVYGKFRDDQFHLSVMFLMGLVLV